MTKASLELIWMRGTHKKDKKFALQRKFPKVGRFSNK